ncbi:ribose-phosphate pyrophosphokinase 2 [Anaeramoeba flamelloides]|uniref:ribose-phosphate diphosphokinase n=1 Tax=Anaeramoeba flamelloides TaxID=1746091 RepID=A0ABQ8ZCE3_9EUKA|nr:ribose-phosphate pyrophosphokinase 2 [Anaeramoeba flamelloides]
MSKGFIFSTKSSQYFADLMLEKLKGEFGSGSLERSETLDGMQYHRVVFNKSPILGNTIVFVASTADDKDFLELLRVGMAISNFGAKKCIFVIPFFGYSTMERAVKYGEIVTAKCNCRLLSSIPNNTTGNLFLMLDLHAPSICHYFEGPCVREELHAKQVLLKGIISLNLDKELIMFGSADLGRTRWVSSYAKYFNTTIALIRKTRNMEETQIHEVIGDVKGKHVVIYDDMTRSGKSLVNACNVYLKYGAISVYAVLSHLALNNEHAAETLINSKIKKIISTNSHQMSQHQIIQKSEKFQILDVSSVFAEKIRTWKISLK